MAVDRTIERIWTGPKPTCAQLECAQPECAQPAWKMAVTVAPMMSEDMAAAPLDDAGDQSLVEACLAGRREAFDVIVRRNQRQIYQLCYRFAGNHEDASDLAQDVFIRAYRGLRSFQGKSQLATWLYRIGVNVCLNRVNSHKPMFAPLDAADQTDHRAERADTAVLRGERAAEVRAAIARLPGKQRATLILRVYHDLPHEQIAGILGSSVGAAKANFFHALANLKKLLQA